MIIICTLDPKGRVCQCELQVRLNHILLDKAHIFLMDKRGASTDTARDAVMLELSRHITVQAYTELRALGVSDLQAFETAARVLRYRCPQLSDQDALFIAADWLDSRPEA